MSESASSLRETLLRQCLAADPLPWYPRDYAESANLDRESFYGPMNDLRLANLVQLTEWQTGKGQGYTITPLGKEVLEDPLFLAQLREGKTTAPIVADQRDAPDTGTQFAIGEAARNAVYFPGRGYVTNSLIIINIVVFLISIIVAVRIGVPLGKFLGGGDPEALQKMGAVTAMDLARGEWWRLVANCFLHFGLMHLTLNMFSLALLRRVESLWGHGRFLILYLTCGLCGSCAAAYYFPGDLHTIVYLAGASGALWGLMASEAVWIVLNRSHLPPSEVRKWNHQLFFTLLLNIGVSMLPNVSAAAHIGGGIAGALSALLLQVHRYGPTSRRTLAGLGLALVPTAFLFLLAFAFDRDPRLQPFLISAFREQLDEHVGRVPPMLDEWEPQAEALHIQKSSERDPAQLAKVQEGLHEVGKQAQKELETVKKSTPSTPTKPLTERGQGLLESIIPFVEALQKHSAGEVVPNMLELRKNYSDARLAYAKLAAK